MIFLLILTYPAEKERIYNFFMLDHYLLRCVQFSLVFRRYTYSPYTVYEDNFFISVSGLSQKNISRYCPFKAIVRYGTPFLPDVSQPRGP